MKQSKQMFAKMALLALVLSLVLTACSPSSSSGGSTTGTSTTAKETKPTYTHGEAVATRPQEEIDRAGFEPRELEDPHVVLWLPYDPQAPFLASLEFYETLYGEDTLEIMTDGWETRYTRLAALVQSGDSPDIVSVYHGDSIPMIVRGLLEPLDDLTDLDNPVYDRGIMDQVFSMNGSAYATVALAAVEPSGLLYNETMFARAGVKTPAEYIAEDNWNWTTLRQLMLDITEDVNDDGVNDVYGLATWHDDIFIIANGVDLVEMKDGKPVLGNKDPRVLEGLQFYQDLVIKDKTMFPHNIGWFEAFKERKVAMMFESPKFQKSRLDAEGFEDEIGFAPFPAGPSATEQVHYTTLTAYGICKNAVNPDAVVAFMEQRATIGYEDVFVKGIGFEDLTEEQFQVYKDMFSDTLHVPFFYSFERMYDRFFALTEEVRGGTTVGTLLERYAPRFESDFNSVMDYAK